MISIRPPDTPVRPSLFERHSPIAVAAVGGLISIVVTVGLTYASISFIGMEQMDWFYSIALAVLCPAIIAPPIVYVQCKAFRTIARQKHELRVANEQLQAALEQVQELSGMLPLCAWCHKVRDDTGYWERVEAFIERNTRRTITHGVCPDCMSRELSKMDGVGNSPDS